jgi:hypothetical protein
VADEGGKHKEELWRWLGISVGGTLLPFGIFALVFGLVNDHSPSLNDVLGHGELFIPALIMNVETMWIWKDVTGWGRSVWYPLIVIACGIAALAGIVCFAVTSSLQAMSNSNTDAASAALASLSHTVPVFSISEFFLAFVLGTVGVVARMLKREEAATGE